MPITQAHMEQIVSEALAAREAFDVLAEHVRDTLEADLGAETKCALLATGLANIPAPSVQHAQSEREHIERTRSGNSAKARRQREKKDAANR